MKKSGAMYVKGKEKFHQPMHGKTGHKNDTKNPEMVDYHQPDHGEGKQKKMSIPAGERTPLPGKEGMLPEAGKQMKDSKNPEHESYEQPHHGGSAKMPSGSGPGPVGKKMKKQGPVKEVGPSAGMKMRKTEDLVAYRKKKYGI